MLLQTAYDRIKIVSDIRETLTQITHALQDMFSDDETVAEVCSMRKYADSRMYALLKEKKIFRMPGLSDIQIVAQVNNINLTPELMVNMGLITDEGVYFLSDRYVLPLVGFDNKVQALICWYPDKRKYITTPTIGFTSTASFFNMQSYTKRYQLNPNKSTVFIVEGIFDALSIESLGYCAMGNQGLDMSPVKKEMLSRFEQVYFIPDNDNPGRKSSRNTCISSNHIWETNYHNYKEILLRGYCKDMDDFIKYMHPQDLSFLNNITDKVIKIQTDKC